MEAGSGEALATKVMPPVSPPPARFLLIDWAPVILWSIVLFLLSTSIFSAANTAKVVEPVLRTLMPWISTTTIDIMHNLIRKLAHFTNYAILFWLMIRGPMAGRPYVALLLCVLY